MAPGILAVHSKAPHAVCEVFHGEERCATTQKSEFQQQRVYALRLPGGNFYGGHFLIVPVSIAVVSRADRRAIFWLVAGAFTDPTKSIFSPLWSISEASPNWWEIVTSARASASRGVGRARYRCGERKSVRRFRRAALVLFDSSTGSVPSAEELVMPRRPDERSLSANME